MGSVVTLTMLAGVLADSRHSAAAYITGLMLDFLTVVCAFLVAIDVIVQQPVEVAERPESR